MPAHDHRPSRRSWDSMRKRLVAPGASHAVMIVVVLMTLFPMLYAVLLATQVPE